MNVIFSMPMMLIAFSALPVLAAIYLLRNRFRMYNVSSLMLWQDQRKARQGGLNINRIQTPLLFLLELLVIIMLVLAAAGPLLRAGRETRMFVIILDNSFSMLAGEEVTVRDRAAEEIRDLLADSDPFQARFILAGLEPELIGEPINRTSQINNIFERWECLAPSANLNKGISLANELAGKTAHILVITDHKPQVVPKQGRIEYWTFGKSISNTAFVNADRTSYEDKDRVFLAVANLSDERTETTLTVESLNEQQIILEKLIELEPNEVYRTIFEPDVGTSTIRARLKNDGLDIDNEIVLVTEPERNLRIRLNIAEEVLDSAVNKVVEAIKTSHLSSIQPHLLITDSPEIPAESSEIWTLQILSEPNAVSYLGPFVVDYSHPLTEGLSLDGIVWGAADPNKFTGMPIIAAGNIPLLTDKETAEDLHDVTINLNHELSTVLESPNWPILFWNLFQWRQSFLPGISQSNIILGTEVTLTKNTQDENCALVDPDENLRKISISAKTVSINPDRAGLYKLTTETNEYVLAVNALSKTESDLTKAQTGKWGRWQQADLFWWEYKPVEWILLLIALSLLVAHRYVTVVVQKGTSI